MERKVFFDRSQVYRASWNFCQPGFEYWLLTNNFEGNICSVGSVVSPEGGCFGGVYRKRDENAHFNDSIETGPAGGLGLISGVVSKKNDCEPGTDFAELSFFLSLFWLLRSDRLSKFLGNCLMNYFA